MKTRSNMPLYVVETNNVKALSNSQIDLLRCGDYLVKKDESGEHAYKVTFKSDTGMCITYHDAYCVETQSYDKVDGNWVYNSEDKTIIAEPQMENIVDADGHKRFIEGDGTPLELEGFTSPYCKWSLSGSHLMLVLAGNVSANTTLPTITPLAEFELPEWVMNKIYPVQGNLLEYKTIVLVKNNFGTLQIPSYLDKGTNTMKIYGNYGTKIEDACAFRIAFDLLIDNE